MGSSVDVGTLLTLPEACASIYSWPSHLCLHLIHSQRPCKSPWAHPLLLSNAAWNISDSVMTSTSLGAFGGHHDTSCNYVTWIDLIVSAEALCFITYPCSTLLLTKRFHSPWPTSRWRRTNLHTHGAWRASFKGCFCIQTGLMYFYDSLAFPWSTHLQSFLGLLKQTSKRNRLLTWRSSVIERRMSQPPKTAGGMFDLPIFHPSLKMPGKIWKVICCCRTGPKLTGIFTASDGKKTVACPSQFPSDPIPGNPELSCSPMPEGCKRKVVSAMNPVANDNTATPVVCAHGVRASC